MRLNTLKSVVVLREYINGADAKYSVKLAAFGLGVMLFDDIASDIINAFRVVIDLLSVNGGDFFIGSTVVFGEFTHIVNLKGQHVSVTNGIHDGVAVQALIK